MAHLFTREERRMLLGMEVCPAPYVTVGRHFTGARVHERSIGLDGRRLLIAADTLSLLADAVYRQGDHALGDILAQTALDLHASAEWLMID